MQPFSDGSLRVKLFESETNPFSLTEQMMGVGVEEENLKILD
jgi:hypothetical protein